MVDKQVRIDLVATDDASRVVADVAGAVDKLEQSDPKIEITADGAAATTEITDVGAAADKLTTDPIRLTVETAMAGVLGDLADVRDALDKTEAKAKTTDDQLDRVGGAGGGTHLRGNAISDLTGPLGDVSSTASDLAGVFDGIGDIAGEVAGKVGISAEAMTGAIGGIGFAIVAATALWSYFTAGQEAARKKQQELVEGQQKLNDKIAEGKYADAATQFQKLYGDALTAAGQLGVPTQALVDFVTGATSNLPQLTAALEEVRSKGAEIGPMFINGQLTTGPAIAGMVASVEGARTKFADTNDTLAISKTKADELAEALAGASGKTDDAAASQQRLRDQVDLTQGALDRMRGALNMESELDKLIADMDTAMANINSGAGNSAEQIRGIKSDILDLAATAKLTPIEVATLLDEIDSGDYAKVKADIETMSHNSPAVISARLAHVTVPLQGSGTFGQNTLTVDIPSPGTTGPQSTTNVFHMGPGTRAADVVREVAGVRRRNGERFTSSGPR